MPVVVGTSGWQYTDWRGLLYQPGVPQRRWLETYAERFATVELNNAFYHRGAAAARGLPPTLSTWHEGRR